MEDWDVMETSGLCWLNSKNKGYLHHRQQGARVLRAGRESLGQEVVNRSQPPSFSFEALPLRLLWQSFLSKKKRCMATSEVFVLFC